MSGEVHCVPVPIAARVIALWSRDPMQDNREFLGNLDPQFFKLAADAMGKVDGAKEEQLAATHIRMLRDQAAEMLFSLLAAAVQSPMGAVLWMLAYRNDELDEVLEAFESCSEIRTASGMRRMGWEGVAREVTQHLSTERPESRGEYVTLHAKFWRGLAKEYTDPVSRKEYASIKHGLRVRPGGCQISLTESTPGVKDPQTHEFHGSGFGSMFHIHERIGGQKIHYRLVHHHRHWTPASLLMQIQLIVNSAQNVIQHLLLLNGEPPPLKWMQPTDPAVFESCWHNEGSLLNLSWQSGLGEADIVSVTQEQLVAHCERPRPGNAP